MMPSPDRKLPLPRNWPLHVRSAIVHAVSMANLVFTITRGQAENHFNARVRLQAENDRLRREISLLQEELRIKDARMERLPAQRRPHYPPVERLAILELRAARGWSLAQTARRLLVTPLTVTSWNKRLDEEGQDALVQMREPVNRFPEFVGYLVRRLKVLCPSMGTRRIAWVLVTAKRPNHVWHVDLTTVPTSLGFWVPWLPHALTQRWPFCWWVAVAVDHYSRRVMGTAVFPSQPSAMAVMRFLDRALTRVRPRHVITDRGKQFVAREFRAWCRHRGIQQRLGAIGKYGSLAVVERFIRSMKSECIRAILIPFSRTGLERELAYYLTWFNADRPHSRFRVRTPDENYFARFPACRRPRFEPRDCWPRRSPAARPHALVRGRPGATLALDLSYRAGRQHLPVVELKRVA